MAALRQRNLFEVYGLSTAASEDDSSSVAQRPPQSKRKRSDGNSEAVEQARKVRRTTSATNARRKQSPIDISSSNAETTTQSKTQPFPNSAALPQSRSPRANAFASGGRPALGELSSDQFQNRLKGPIAWFKRPAYNRAFLSQFSRTPSPDLAHAPSSARGRSPVGTSGGRSRRAAARTSYVSLVSSPEGSEDELALDVRLPSSRKKSKAAQATKKRGRPKTTRYSDDSDFQAEETASDEPSEDCDVLVEDSSSVQPSESDEVPVIKKSTKAKTGKANPSSSAAKTSPTKAKASGETKKTTSRKKSENMVNLLKASEPTASKVVKGLDPSQAPMSDIKEIFEDMTTKALKLGFEQAIKQFSSRRLRVATMCSGTESPLLALEMIQSSLAADEFQVEHLFSAELVPFKQAYIERNFNPPVIFRDITELIDAFESETPMATTAYGARVPVPKELDMIIAGTSCVDYSGMNSRKKGIHDGGESGDTWQAVLDFCIAARPAIVLLENVRFAPWDDMLEDYRKIGYETVGAIVNTKDYYIPQVRQRGYMACFDRERLRAAGVSEEAAASRWASLMGDFKRPASSPVSDFLLPNDRIVRQQLRIDEPTREVDWSTCEIRQMQYREEFRLGNARPITHWSASGSMLVPDNGHIQWYQRQVERVLDTIDVGNLRKALPKFGMYDNRFKTRVVDLSQNVDRESDHRAFGIVGCITPTGMFFVSDAGRPLTAEETLQLQGLPLDRVSFTTESPADVQDLAGNAMSTTVIGSSILSALIAGCKIMSVGTETAADVDVKMHNPERMSARLISGDTETIQFRSDSGNAIVMNILKEASLSLRKCFCEGAKGTTSKSIQQCLDCDHITCIACGGNPSHNYRQAPRNLNSARLPPGQFEQQLRSMLPLRLRLCEDEAVVAETLRNVEDAQYCEQVRKALTETFYFQHIRRTFCWSMIYQSNEATLELAIENEASAEWRLFAHAPRNLPVSHKLRTLLRQPVARSRVQSDAESFFAGDWEIRLPKGKSLAMTVTASGSKLASWWARNEMPDFLEHFVWETLTIAFDKEEGPDAVSGVYRHLPHCGTACNGLYKKIGEDSRPLFLFLDPTRIGDPDNDCFVFSYNKTVLEYDEVRSVIARIAPSWRPWTTDQTRGGISRESKTKLLVDEEWHSLPSDVKLFPARTNLEIQVPQDSARLIESLSCSEAAILVSCTLPRRQATGDESPQPHEPVFYEKYAWIFEAMRRHLPSEDWALLRSDRTDCQCDDCAPIRPEIRWVLSDNGNIVPQEDPETAAAYERAIKSRPAPLLVTLGEDGRRLDVGVNMISLAHRAGSRLQLDCGPKSTVSYAWRLTTSVQQADSFAFKPFKLTPTTDVEACSKDLGLEIDLFPKQQLALAWMRTQEIGVDFMLEAIEESSIASLGWQAEAKAQTFVNIRGGICADHPGFGKTILSLALIHSEWIEKGKAGILADIRSRQSTDSIGLMPIAATLIVCPAALLKQWQSEIADKVRIKSTVIAINAMADLDKYTISSFANATIILVNRTLLGNQMYAERLANFAGVPGPATKSGRSFAHWLKSVEKDVPEHVQMLKEGFGLKELQAHLKAVYKANLDSEKFRMSVPSRRLRGRDYVAGKDRKKPSAENTAAASHIDVSHVGRPLLEMFCFNRIMVDEFHQYDPKERAAIAGFKADKRWGLSATPAMDDFYDVAQTASLLGVSLRTSSGAKGVLKTKNARDLKKEMTSFEQFDLMREIPSDSLHAHIHATDQRFLDTFVRRNLMDFHDKLVCYEHLVPVRLDVSHMALYAEISQHLNSLDMRIRRGTKAKATDRQERFHSVINDCSTAEEALSKAAAFLQGEEREFNEIISLRYEQTEEVLGKLPEALRAAVRDEPVAFMHWKASRLDGGMLGDREAIQQVSALTRTQGQAPKNSKQLQTSNADSDADSVDQAGGKVSFAGKKEKTAKLNAMCGRLLKAQRSARYLQNVKRIVAGKKKANHLCDNPECEERTVSAEQAGASVLCGHLVCRECYMRLKQQGGSRCLADGCSESLQDIHVLWSRKMGDLSKLATTHGAKAEAAIKLLRSIEKAGDQAILFVQYQEQLDEISAALDDEGTSAAVVRFASDAGNQIEKFRDSAGTKKQITVMVLNASDETAAGLNLQNANHVIFLSPLLRDSQYGYDSTMAQAIGRVRRYGQKKQIHVYRIFALDTIDVDILEHRERRNTALTEQDGPDVAPLAGGKEMGGEEKKEKTQLVCEDGYFSLRPQSWLVRDEANEDVGELNKVKGKNRVLGWEDFSSLVKFSKTFTEDDDW